MGRKRKPICQECREFVDRSAGGYLIITYRDKASSEILKDKRFYLHEDCVASSLDRLWILLQMAK